MSLENQPQPAPKFEDRPSPRELPNLGNDEIGWDPRRAYRPTVLKDNSRFYEPKCARWVQKLRELGAEIEALEDFFGVDATTLAQWARKHHEFDDALKARPTALGTSSEDIGIFNWLKDYRRHALDL